MQFGVQFFPDVKPEEKSAEAYGNTEKSGCRRWHRVESAGRGERGTGRCSGRGAFRRRNTPARRSRRGATSFGRDGPGVAVGAAGGAAGGAVTARASAA